MSIINEALKKSRQDKPSQNMQPISTSFLNADLNKKFTVDLPKKKNNINWGPIFVLLVLVLITGPLVAPIFSSPYRSTTSAFLVPSYQATLAASQDATNRQAQFAIEESPILPVGAAMIHNPITPIGIENRPTFAINGIVYSSPESYCIINGRVVRVGDKIDGAILKSVSPEKAVLDFNGTKIDLWVNND